MQRSRRREGINPNVFYKWSKDFLEAGKKRLQGDTVREATSGEVTELKGGERTTQNIGRGIEFEEPCAEKKFEWFGIRLGRMMRYSQTEKMEIIRLVENSRALGEGYLERARC